ncbi:hypothetical protein [Actinomadura macra]|uniref:hypothetical protein n=1 Tax=Actinomadura macra TaxID=46164 RepID=UPI000829874F|nr:hypothetical protein [Actinomadura macra]
MTHAAWADLPERVRDAVQARTGEVTVVTRPPAGNHAHFAGKLTTLTGPVFVKGARKEPDRDGSEVAALRNEARINPHVQPFAPRLLWTIDRDGCSWALSMFELAMPTTRLVPQTLLCWPRP